MSKKNNNDTNKQIEDLKTRWIQEQYVVASQVIVLPDPIPITTIATTTSLPTTSIETSDDEQRHHQQQQLQDRFVEIPLEENVVTNSIIMTVDDDTDSSAISNNDTKLSYYGGVDVSFPEEKDDDDEEQEQDETITYSNNHCYSQKSKNEAVAVYVIIEYPTMKVVYTSHIYFILTVPYIPSFLAFREIDPIQYLIQDHQKKVVEQQKQQQQEEEQHISLTNDNITIPPIPSVILVDGNGIYHTRSAGLACFVGTRTNIPTIGIGKTFYQYSNFDSSSNVMTKKLMHEIISNSIISAVQYYTCNNKHINKTRTVDTSSTIPIVLFDRYTDVSSRPTSLASNDDDIFSNSSNNNNKQLLMESLSQICYGLAIPIIGTCYDVDDRSTSNKGDTFDSNLQQQNQNKLSIYHNCIIDNSNKRILAYALVGHGGGRKNNQKKTKKDGTKCTPNSIIGTCNPIYISVGHYISLQEAVQICCLLCINTRIPEPIRQADLIGRALLREKKKRKENEKVNRCKQANI